MKIRQATWLTVSVCLAAMGPAHAANESGDQPKVLKQLVGTWDVEYRDIQKDGREKHRTGQFTVAWVLDGRAIQDVWIVDPSEGRQEREVYAAIQYFDSKSRSWPMVFIDPEHASTAKLTGGVTPDGRLVLQTSDLGRPQNRWSFTATGPDSFVFRDEFSSDGGETWKLLSEDHLKRHRDAASH